MLQLFMSRDDTHYPVTYLSRMDYVKRRCLEELRRIQLYYHGRENNTSNTHVISKLVHMLYSDFSTDPMKVFRDINANRDYIARQLGFVSDISFGKVLNNYLYNSNSKEVYISVENFIDPYDFQENWRAYVPIRVVYTDELNIDFYNFDGTKDKQFESLTVVEVDINILMLMYNYWGLHRIKNDLTTNVNRFVRTVVLPKMMGSMLDLTLWNRFMNLFYNNNMYRGYVYKHPFHVIDFKPDIDYAFKNILGKVSNKSMKFNNLIEYVPSVYNTKMNNALLLNRIYYTKQSEWSVWVSRLDYIDFLLDIGGEKGYARNSIDIKKLPQYIRLLENGSTPIDRQIDGEIKKEFYQTLEKVKSKVDKR